MESRALIVAPTGKDASLTYAVLTEAGIEAHVCPDTRTLCAEAGRGAGCILLAEEALGDDGPLAALVARQPPWSDIPVLILAHHGADSPAVSRAMDTLGNVTLLERPTPVALLVSTVRAALRARARQYQIRASLAEREQSAETLQRQTELLEQTHDAIFAWEIGGGITYWNRGAELLYGYTKHEALGRNSHELLRTVHARGMAAIGAELDRTGQWTGELRQTTRDGRCAIVDTRWVRFGAHGGRKLVLETGRDITERKQMEEALRESDRRKDEFLATLAHELRNPLAPIGNVLTLMRMKSSMDEPELVHARDLIGRQVHTLVRLVDDLLDVSRITHGHIDLRKERIQLADAVHSALDTSRPLIESAGHSLGVALPPEPVWLDADPIRLAQVFSNLLNNAAKYTPRGGRIELCAERDAGSVRVRIRDTGIGIAPDIMPRIFELFVQGDRTLERSRGGLGVGLTLVRQFVHMHGGTVRAHSEGEGRGSVFTVTLPACASPAAPEAGDGAGSRSAGRGPGRRILVVDDNVDSAETLKELLLGFGNDVRTAYDGLEAVSAAADFEPDVVLLDIGLPKMNGYDVARRLRQQTRGRDLMLVALTGWGQEEDRKRSREAGYDHHLVKPVDLSSLRELLAGSAAGR
jgi:PAS domain S-box-containing protein